MKNNMKIIVGAATLFSAFFAQADLIAPISGLASSNAGGRDFANLYNGETVDGEMQLTGGMDANNYADWQMNAFNDTFGNGEAWAADSQDTSGPAAWVIIDLGENYVVSTMSIWNMNPSADDWIGRSAEDLNIYYTLDRSGDSNTNNSEAAFSTTGWTTYSSDLVLSQNDGGSTITAPNGLLTDMNITARYIAVEVESTYRMPQDFGKATIGELQFFSAVVPEPSTLGLLVFSTLGLLLRRRMH